MINKTLTIILFVVCQFSAQAQLTNHVNIIRGICFSLINGHSGIESSAFDARDEISYSLTGPLVQGIGFAVLPPQVSFIFTLHDTNGQVVARTAKGSEYSKELDEIKMMDDLKRKYPQLTPIQQRDLLAKQLNLKFQSIDANSGVFKKLFVPDDYFVITNKGIYILEVQMRVWTQKTNGEYGIVISDPARVEVKK